MEIELECKLPMAEWKKGVDISRGRYIEGQYRESTLSKGGGHARGGGMGVVG